MFKKNWRSYLFTAIVIISAIFLFESAYSDKFYPGVSVGGLSVGGQSLKEVMVHFGDEAKILTDTGLRFDLIDSGVIKEVSIPISARGLTSDKSFEYFSLGNWEQTISDAYAFGRTGSIWQRSKEQISLILKKEFNLPSTLYEVAVRSFLSRELDLFLKKTEPAQFALDKKGALYIMPEKIGEKIDPEEIMNILKEKISSFDSSPETFKTKINVPVVTTEKLEPFLGLAEGIAQKTNLVFHYKGYEWRLTGLRLATWLSVNDQNNITIDSKKLESFLSKTVATVIDDAPENSRFEIRNGKLTEISAGKSGTVVNIKKTAEKVEQIIPEVEKSFARTGNMASALSAISDEINFNIKTGIINIPIDVIQEEPKVTKETIDQHGIKDLVGSSKTSFKGSSKDRINNITVGTSVLNGLLIAPGEEFSAVNAIGYVTEEAGYAKEFVIKDNKSVKELGGGLCQIGTTLFRMALDAGLPITERANHRYVVGYYGPGLDATIYGPHPDLRFINDTGNYLLLQGRVEGTDVTLELYGQNDGRQVIIGDPVLTNHIPAPTTLYVPTADLAPGVEECSETPRAGVTADVTYTVALRSGEIREQHFNSVYQPWQKICLLGVKK